jgi:Undecaprenyl-phosphate galactose phosphotransferase WbaP
MSTAAKPALTARSFPPARWAPWTILAADVLALELAFALGLILRRALAPWFPAEIGPDQYLGVGIGILLLPAVNYQLGLYPGYLLGPVERLRRRLLATLAVFGGLVAWDNLVARGVFSRGVLLATLLFALVLPPLAETVARAGLLRMNRWGVPVLMLGAGECGRTLTRTLSSDAQLGLKPIAYLDNRPELWHKLVEGTPVMGPLGLASDYASLAEAAIVSLADLSNEDVGDLLQELNFPRVVVVPDLAGIASLWVTARDLGGCLGFEIKKNLLLRRNHFLKRLMDQTLALPLCIAAIPIIVCAAIWIKLSSRGPVFYRQIREGYNGRFISVWKLRTMHQNGDMILEEWLQTHPHDREQWRRFFKLRDDPRVLPVIGTLLRRTSLDELPQLWNVLRGEMSLVGPRPLPDYHLEQFTAEFRRLRGRVLPGLTGLWQVSSRGNGDTEAQEALDTFYIRNWSPWLDLYILARTVTAVLLARGAY